MSSKENVKATKDKKNITALMGAAFIMATSAIGPGFLTQTATFTETYKASFGFVVLITTILFRYVPVKWTLIKEHF